MIELKHLERITIENGVDDPVIETLQHFSDNDDTDVSEYGFSSVGELRRSYLDIQESNSGLCEVVSIEHTDHKIVKDFYFETRTKRLAGLDSISPTQRQAKKELLERYKAAYNCTITTERTDL